MEKILIVSCVADDNFSSNANYLLNERLDQVKEGASKLAAEKAASSILYLLPEDAPKADYGAETATGIYTPTGGNAYSCEQQLVGNLPRPMIQDDFIAVYEGKEIVVITPGEAYEAVAGDDIKVLTVNIGDKREVKEVKVGTKVSDVVDVSGAKAVLVGGLRGKFITPAAAAEEMIFPYFMFDSITVYDNSTCIVDTVAKMYGTAQTLSCGKCVMCREGTLQFKTILEEMTTGKAKPSDLDLLKDVGELVKVSAYCPFGQNMPTPMLTAMSLFSDEFETHIKRKSCAAGVCYKAAAVYVIMPDLCQANGDCVDECDEDAITFKKGFISMIDQDMCEQCGKCVSACDEGAIVKIEGGKLPKLPKKATKVGRF